MSNAIESPPPPQQPPLSVPPLGKLLHYMHSSQIDIMQHTLGVSTLLHERGGCPKSKKSSKKCKHRVKPPSPADFDSLITVCDACGAHGRSMPRCTGCSRVRYCNVNCQRSSWISGHHRCAQIVETGIDGEFSYQFAVSRFVSIEKLRAIEPIIAVAFENYVTYYNYCRIITEWSQSCLYTKDADSSDVAREFACPAGVAQLICSHPTSLYVRVPAMRCAIAQWAQEIVDIVRILFDVQLINTLPERPPLFWRDVGIRTTLRWDLRSSANNIDSRCQHIVTSGEYNAVDDQYAGISVRLIGGHDDKHTLMHMSLRPSNPNDVSDTFDIERNIYAFWQRNKCILHDEQLFNRILCDGTDEILLSSVEAMRKSRITAIEIVDAQENLDIFTRDTLVDRACECECFDQLEMINVLASPNVECARMGLVRVHTECGILEVVAVTIRKNKRHYTITDNVLPDTTINNPFLFTISAPYFGMRTLRMVL